MGWCLYLVNQEDKLIVPCGKVTEQQFLEDYETFKKAINMLNELDYIDLDEIKYKNLTLADVKQLLKTVEFFNSLSSIYSSWLGLSYYWHCENNDVKLEFTFDTSNDFKKFSNYKRI